MDDDQEDDPVVHEIPVYLSQALTDNLHLLQYPLRPAYMPYDGSSVIGARIKPSQGSIEFDVAMETRGPHYSRSRGEQFARLAEGDGGVAYFKSGLMDQQTLTSGNFSKKTESRYVAGVLKDGELHLTPLKSIIQLRPTLRHFEVNESSGVSKPPGTGALSDGDTTATESEEDEARPVTVRFARGGMKQTQSEPEESWQSAVYHSIQSVEATEERKLLFGMVEDHTSAFTCSQQEFLNLVCPMEISQQSTSPSGPSGVLSLTKLKTLPLERQVTELMKKAMLLQFDRVCTMLGRRGQERAAVLDDLQRCAVLVQGCWIVCSSLVLSKELRNARDYVLWCFTKSPVLTRKDLTSVLKITSPQLRELLQPLSVFKAGSGWHFKQDTDKDFIARYPSVVESQKSWWEKRHKEIVLALGIGVSPDAAAAVPQSQTGIISGQQLVSISTQKAKEMITTPSRQHLLSPGQLIKNEGAGDTESLEGIPEHIKTSLQAFLFKTIGKGVASLEQLKRELISHQTRLPENERLKERELSDSLIISLLAKDAVNVGEPHGKLIYAVKRIGDDKTDPYREIVLEMFHGAGSVKKRQFVDEITKRLKQCDAKLLYSLLRELARTNRSGVWTVVGFDS